MNRRTARARRFIPTPVGNASASTRARPKKPVHPHARGERDAGPKSGRLNAGSSPRPWGTRGGRQADRTIDRFIPTPVGNARWSITTWPWPSVHPHARGERQLGSPRRLRVIGSSPRPWGTPPPPCPASCPPRFIPTPVGNAACWRRASGHWPVHPHARGERVPFVPGAPSRSGSSPRPWGTRRPAVVRAAEHRFIPTPVGNAQPTAPATTGPSVHPHARGERVSAPGQRQRRRRFIPTPVGNARRRPTTRIACTVHPHARGERPYDPKFTGQITGSSPRPWGTHQYAPGLVLRHRFIPTPVGNAPGIVAPARGIAVHPHARGERDDGLQIGDRLIGSSPRPWGTRAPTHSWQLSRRFIPTPVGNARPGDGERDRRSVHPHARGERLSTTQHQQSIIGSSPRPWGTLGCRLHRAGQIRFIPTPVGNARDHHSTHRRVGSSPRPWGTRHLLGAGVGGGRFIPTPVGNACMPSPTWRRFPVHPHARGERVDPNTRVLTADGSSPRPWGTLDLDRVFQGDGRFIPTPVGNARHRAPHCGWSPVHPHARGERQIARDCGHDAYGSSPRPWGTPSAAELEKAGQRFIPTPVGNA